MENDYKRNLRARFSSSSSSVSRSYTSYTSYSSLSFNRYYGGYGYYILIFNYYYNDYDNTWVNQSDSNSTTKEISTLQIIAYCTSSIISFCLMVFFSCYCYVRVERNYNDSDSEVEVTNVT